MNSRSIPALEVEELEPHPDNFECVICHVRKPNAEKIFFNCPTTHAANTATSTTDNRHYACSSCTDQMLHYNNLCPIYRAPNAITRGRPYG